MQRLAVLIGFATACGSPTPPRPVGNAAPAPSASMIELAGDHLGGVTAATPITVERIGGMFPDATATERAVEYEDGIHPLVEVHRGNVLVVTFVHDGAGKLVAADVTGRDIQTRSGIGVGARYEDLAAGLGGVDCLGMVEEDSGDAICWSLATPQLAAILPMAQDDSESKYYARPIPPAEAAVVLRGAVVTRMRWRP